MTRIGRIDAAKAKIKIRVIRVQKLFALMLPRFGCGLSTLGR